MNITATLFAQIAAFLILIWLVNRLLWGPLTTALESRRKEISDGLAAAEQGKNDLVQAREQAAEIEQNARDKATSIVTHAEKRAAEIVEEAKLSAQEEGDNIRRAAQAEVEQKIIQARETLRRQLAEVAMRGAERILEREIDATAHESALKELEKQL